MEIMKNGRLIIAIVTNLLDEALIIFVILWGLPKLGVNIPLYLTIVICSGFVVYAVLVYKMGSRALFKRPVEGFTDQIGMEGEVVVTLNPRGTVNILGELWEARAEGEEIKAGLKIRVVSQTGFKLTVRPLNNITNYPNEL
jgi:membrane-bound ClpP family serine protease